MGRALILLLLALLAAPATSLADGGGPSAQIYYGHEAAVGEHPYQAFVETSVGSCGGVLVGSRQVLTAGHCVSAVDVALPGNVTVRLGSRDLSAATSFAVEAVEPNQDFDSKRLQNDSAMLTLELPVPYAPLPVVPADHPELWAPGVTALVSGWGEREDTTFPERLYEASIPIRADSDCAAAYGKDFDAATMLCAGGGTPSVPGADTCRGDSGGPLTVPGGPGRVLAGLTSWGGACSESPGVYTRLGAPSLNGWVNQRIPHADFTYSPATPGAGQPATFSGTATPAAGAAGFDTFGWDFDGDGQFDDGTGATASWTFPTGGTHQVGFEATAGRGDRVVAAHTLDVAPALAPDERTGFPASPAAADRVAPVLHVRVPATALLARALRRGIPVRVRCSESCRVSLTLRLAPRTARRLGLRALMARRVASLDGEIRRLIRLRLPRRATARLTSLHRLRLRVAVTATDGAGNSSVARDTVRLVGR